MKPTKAGIVPLNATVVNQCHGGTRGLYFRIQTTDLQQYSSLSGEGVLTHNHYKDGILCNSGTISIQGPYPEHCETGQFECGVTDQSQVEKIEQYCKTVPWSGDCGDCGDTMLLRRAKSNHRNFHAPGDIIEFFATE